MLISLDAQNNIIQSLLDYVNQLKLTHQLIPLPTQEINNTNNTNIENNQTIVGTAFAASSSSLSADSNPKIVKTKPTSDKNSSSTLLNSSQPQSSQPNKFRADVEPSSKTDLNKYYILFILYLFIPLYHSLSMTILILHSFIRQI
jgi:hypothetical protein